MARKARADVEGGLYHVITNRRIEGLTPTLWFMDRRVKLKRPDSILFDVTLVVGPRRVQINIQKKPKRGQACDSAIPAAKG